MDNFERICQDDLIIIKPKGYMRTPLDCPVCKTAFSTREDVLSFKSFGCCQECDLVYRRPNLSKWNSGWRPKL